MVNLAFDLLGNLDDTSTVALTGKLKVLNVTRVVYELLGEYNQAKELHEKALMIRKKIFGEDHANVVTSYSNLALVYYKPKEHNRAKELHEKALMIGKVIFGEVHVDVATSYHNLALVYNCLKENNQAKELHEKALMIRQEIFGEDHADVATSYNNLALVYYNLKEYNRAKELHEKALMIGKMIFGEDHAVVEKRYKQLGITIQSPWRLHSSQRKHVVGFFKIVFFLYIWFPSVSFSWSGKGDQTHERRGLKKAPSYPPYAVAFVQFAV